MPTMDPLELDISAMRHQVQIQTQASAPDAVTGNPTQAWATVRTTWAKISTVSTRELFQANQYVDQASHMLVVRYSAVPLAAGMQVLYGTRTFTIQNVENVLERNIRMNLVCQEIDGVSA